MKYLLLLLLIITSDCAFGQQLTGLVTDKSNKQPISSALVSCGAAKTYTNTLGMFSLDRPANADSLTITRFTYKTLTIPVTDPGNLQHIELQSTVTALKEVVILSHRNEDFKRDSIANRQDFAPQFNYTPPKVTDVFAGNTNKGPGELISINLLVLAEVLTQKSNPQYKFKQKLLKDEQAEYIDRSFNTGSVSRLTGLKGATLEDFLAYYRPTYQFAKKATEYEMQEYIKDCFKKYKLEVSKGNDPFKGGRKE